MYLTTECDTRYHLFNKHSVCCVPATVLSALKISNPPKANEIEILVLSSLLQRKSLRQRELVTCLRSQYQPVPSQEKKNHFGYFRRNVITSIFDGIPTEGLEEQKGERVSLSTGYFDKSQHPCSRDTKQKTVSSKTHKCVLLRFLERNCWRY